MPILRNPFARRVGGVLAANQNENTRPASSSSGASTGSSGFEPVDTVGFMASSALSIRSRRREDTGEYKMSVVNDSGEFLPPSPPADEKAMWPRRYLSSRASSDTGSSSLSDIEPFSISRESFDSYRRSFDISAKSPIMSSDPLSSRSFDSSRFSRFPRARLADSWGPEPPPITPEESFEDVGLEDGAAAALKPAAPRKRSFFAKFSDPAAAAANPDGGMSSGGAPNPGDATPPPPVAPTTTTITTGTTTSTTTAMSRFLIPTRRRGHSQSREQPGSELGLIMAGKQQPVAEVVELQAQEVR